FDHDSVLRTGSLFPLRRPVPAFAANWCPSIVASDWTCGQTWITTAGVNEPNAWLPLTSGENPFTLSNSLFKFKAQVIAPTCPGTQFTGRRSRQKHKLLTKFLAVLIY